MESMLSVYQQLCQGKNYKAQVCEIWYRESYFNELIMEKDVEEARPRQAYLLHDILDSMPFARKGSDRLLGFQLHVKGPAAWLFFAKETGLQSWYDTRARREILGLFGVSPTASPLAPNLHLPNYFKNMPIRRQCHFPNIRDAVWRVNRELGNQSYPSYLNFQLEQQLRSSILENME
jgi:hypothetical protein